MENIKDIEIEIRAECTQGSGGWRGNLCDKIQRAFDNINFCDEEIKELLEGETQGNFDTKAHYRIYKVHDKIKYQFCKKFSDRNAEDGICAVIYFNFKNGKGWLNYV